MLLYKSERFKYMLLKLNLLLIQTLDTNTNDFHKSFLDSTKLLLTVKDN